ncbi:acyl-CoA dehydrogenase [Nocardia jinanensis]|uniref:Acyl-CoA dehydrogenase FadE22 n=1 Tax=Nocardia jinanensis TaxID=382504 RepID=A0A917RNP0_9NOCA|nr:acyl-CoA dehydrogenase [Nocardia jinanensis]GGL15797.1 acyl-CoA dehydrogenase FadE22 [Nocardia jinanensis]
MPLALTDDHLAIAAAVRSFLTDQKAQELARGFLDDPETDGSGLWKQLSGLGWLGLHLPTEFGGDDYGLPELAIVAEELGAVVAPVPFIPTVVTSSLLAASDAGADGKALLPGFADGSQVAGLGLRGALAADDSGTLSGHAGHVVGAGAATLFALRVGDDIALVRADADGVGSEAVDALDPTLQIRSVTLRGVSPEVVLPGAAAAAARTAQALGAAEAAGGARATLEHALGYAKVREQFGRAIGSFQAVKHHLANMLAGSELAVATAWDAARAGVHDEQGALATNVAGVIAYDEYVRNAEKSVQIHGGIGFTWEHDCHLYLRRAQSIRALFGAVDAAHHTVYTSAAQGVRREYAVDLPPEAEAFRAAASAFVDELRTAPESDRRRVLVDSGYLMPHWRKPFGREAGPVEQLVIDEEFADVELPNLGIGAWVTLTLSQHGTPAQIERWIRASLLGELVWCQLFSEPGAGSDAAAVSTRGVRVDGGWRVTGQKVWTSNAQNCNRGLATIRTDRDAPKHKGITAVVIDLHAPGVEVRPLREITGDAVFNEVFFDDVFVPDADVVGEVNNGWAVARATLGNERVSIGGMAHGRTPFDLIELVRAGGDDTSTVRAVADLLAHEQALQVLNLRHVARAVTGAAPGPEGSVTKMLSAEHLQRTAEAGMRLAGEAAVVGQLPEVSRDYLFGRAHTIAGGTSEINRNVIAERLLGLPREQIAR